MSNTLLTNERRVEIPSKNTAYVVLWGCTGLKTYGKGELLFARITEKTCCPRLDLPRSTDKCSTAPRVYPLPEEHKAQQSTAHPGKVVNSQANSLDRIGIQIYYTSDGFISFYNFPNLSSAGLPYVF